MMRLLFSIFPLKNNRNTNNNDTSNHNASNNDANDNSLTMKKECQVCFEYHSTSLFSKITAKCNHELNICDLCVSKHISTQLDSKGVAINCPFDGCDRKMQHHDVKKFVSKKLFERFDAFMLCQTLSKLPEFRWCKNSGCSSGQIHFEKDNAPIMTCRACGQRSCYTHDIPWHRGLTCSQYESTKRGNDKATKAFIQSKTKPCPQCGIRIIKDGGCNHMYCTACKKRFNWSWF